LERQDLLNIITVQEYGGTTSAGWHNSYGSGGSVNFPYSRKDEVVLTDFGMKYIEWVKN
jgi:hypothetical protein